MPRTRTQHPDPSAPAGVHSRLLRTCAVAALLALASGTVPAESAHHVFVEPANLKWAPVPSLPPGAQVAVLEGPINEAGPFTMRLKFPANYRIPPHWHPAVERVTVLSGTFHIAGGESFDTAKGRTIPAGGMVIMPAKSPHYAWTTGETVVQLHGTGPWGITYLNPAEDPRSR